MGLFLPMVKARFFDANGDPLSGGLVYTYVAGTSTPLATYSDQEITPNTNPVVLDSNGEADIILASASTYKIILTNSVGTTQWTVDNVAGTGSGTAVSGGWTAFVSHSVTDGQSATNLSGETFTSASYTSVDYSFEVIRGTTVNASGEFSAQLQNGTWRIVLGPYRGDIHGVTFTLSGTTTQQLLAALNSGAGNGTIKLSKRYIAV
jgi:hypothetical protein